MTDMTDDEILARAEEIKEQRARGYRKAEIVEAIADIKARLGRPSKRLKIQLWISDKVGNPEAKKPDPFYLRGQPADGLLEILQIHSDSRP